MRRSIMLAKITKYKATFLLIAIWVVLFPLSKRFDLLHSLAARGINNIGHDYYRFFTGPLLHFNLVHLLINTVAIYWVGYFAEQSIGSVRFFTFGLIASALAECVYSYICNNSENNIGGSVWVFSFIGLIIVLQLLKPAFPRFHLGAKYGNWILAYGILGNIPVLSFMSFGTVITHLCALVIGSILGVLGIYLKVL